MWQRHDRPQLSSAHQLRHVGSLAANTLFDPNSDPNWIWSTDVRRCAWKGSDLRKRDSGVHQDTPNL